MKFDLSKTRCSINVGVIVSSFVIWLSYLRLLLTVVDSMVTRSLHTASTILNKPIPGDTGSQTQIRSIPSKSLVAHSLGCQTQDKLNILWEQSFNVWSNTTSKFHSMESKINPLTTTTVSTGPKEGPGHSRLRGVMTSLSGNNKVYLDTS